MTPRSRLRRKCPRAYPGEAWRPLTHRRRDFGLLPDLLTRRRGRSECGGCLGPGASRGKVAERHGAPDNLLLLAAREPSGNGCLLPPKRSRRSWRLPSWPWPGEPAGSPVHIGRTDSLGGTGQAHLARPPPGRRVCVTKSVTKQNWPLRPHDWHFPCPRDQMAKGGGSSAVLVLAVKQEGDSRTRFGGGLTPSRGCGFLLADLGAFGPARHRRAKGGASPRLAPTGGAARKPSTGRQRRTASCLSCGQAARSRRRRASGRRVGGETWGTKGLCS